MFFNFHIVSKSPAEISTPISAVLELSSRANLPCLVKLALRVYTCKSKLLLVVSCSFFPFLSLHVETLKGISHAGSGSDGRISLESFHPSVRNYVDDTSVDDINNMSSAA